MMDSGTTEYASASNDDFESSDHSSKEETETVEHQFQSLGEGSSPHNQQQPSDGSRGIIPTRPLTISLSLNTSPSRRIGAGQAQARGRSLRSRRLRGHSSLTPSGNRIREIVRSRPRCGLYLLRSLRNDKHWCAPEARSDPEKAPRQPGREDELFTPKDGDLLLHHVKKLGKRVVEFFDAEQAPRFEEGDYLLRFKVENYSFMRQSFVTALGFLYHHGKWLYLGKDGDQMDLGQLL